MKKIKPSDIFTKRRITGLVFLAGALITAWAALHTKGFMQQMLSVLSIFFDMGALYCICISMESERKCAKRIKSFMVSFTRAVFKFIKKVMDKLSLSHGKSFNTVKMIKGYNDVTEKAGGDYADKKKKKKHKRYKYMDNVEKVRFLYEKRVTGAIKNGIEIEESMTPIEAGDIMAREKYMKDNNDILIETYNQARYDDKSVITDDMVKKIQ